MVPLIDWTILHREAELSFSRSSGPGGQNVNKVNSKAILRWNVRDSEALSSDVKGRFLARYESRISAEGVLTLLSDQHRDQGRNIEECFSRLRSLIREVLLPPKVRKKTRVPRAIQEKRLSDKRVNALRKRTRSFRGEE